jgi:hypothetical protein
VITVISLTNYCVRESVCSRESCSRLCLTQKVVWCSMAASGGGVRWWRSRRQGKTDPKRGWSGQLFRQSLNASSHRGVQSTRRTRLDILHHRCHQQHNTATESTTQTKRKQTNKFVRVRSSFLLGAYHAHTSACSHIGAVCILPHGARVA